MPDDRRGGSSGQAGNLGKGVLILDLHVVSDRVLDQVVLDQPVDERLSAVRIAEI